MTPTAGGNGSKDSNGGREWLQGLQRREGSHRAKGRVLDQPARGVLLQHLSPRARRVGPTGARAAPRGPLLATRRGGPSRVRSVRNGSKARRVTRPLVSLSAGGAGRENVPRCSGLNVSYIAVKCTVGTWVGATVGRGGRASALGRRSSTAMAQRVLATRPAESSVAPADARPTSCAAVTGPCRAARIALQPHPPRARSPPYRSPYRTLLGSVRDAAFRGGRSSPAGRSTAVLRPKAHRAQRGYGRRRAPGGSSTGQAQTARPRPVRTLSAENAPPGRPKAPAARARGVQRAAQGGARPPRL
jgi:hypothetical protein